MIFAHDTEVALTAAAALVNTDSDTEELAGLADLDQFVDGLAVDRLAHP